MLTQAIYIAVQALYVGSEWALIAIAFGFVVRTTNIFHLALGGMYTVGSGVFYYLTVRLGASQLGAAVLAIFLTGLLGTVIDRLVYQPVTGSYGRRKAAALSPFVASLGVLIILQNGAQLALGASPLYVPTPDLGIVTIGGARVLTWNLVKVVISLGFALLFMLWLSRTRTGATALALGQSVEGAGVVGISESAVRLQIFFATGLFAGLGGVLAILSHPSLPHEGLPIVLYGSLIALILPNASALMSWILAICFAAIYSSSIAMVGGGWEDVILQCSLMTGIIITRIVLPMLERRRIVRRLESGSASNAGHSGSDRGGELIARPEQ
jgi:branched-chain amino acid transport system permease protein